MRNIFVMITLIIVSILSAAEPIPPLTKVQYDTKWYEQQAKEWKNETKRNPNNKEAWINYFKAVRYALKYSPSTKVDSLQDIINDMEKHIPNTFEYYYARYEHKNSVEDAEYLWKAHTLKPDNPELLYDVIAMYAKMGDNKKFHNSCMNLYHSKDIFRSLLNYNYNMLVSISENGILLTNGDNDTFPAWVLQEAKGIRTDVSVINVSLCYDDNYRNNWMRRLGIPELKEYRKVSDLISYLNNELSERDIYIASSVDENGLKDISSHLYNVGIVSLYNEDRIDNIAILKHNLEHQYRMDYLYNDWYNEDHVSASTVSKGINVNYIPAIIILSEHYRLMKDNYKADEWMQLAIALAERSGNKQIVDYIHKRSKK